MMREYNIHVFKNRFIHEFIGSGIIISNKKK